MTTEIILAGFGGQGILFAGKILAYCGLIAGKELGWLARKCAAVRQTAPCAFQMSRSVLLWSQHRIISSP